jgi:hypothetical protein
MEKKLMTRTALLLVIVLFPNAAEAQGSNFLNHLRVGFGTGVNFSHVYEVDSYNLYEDLTGETYKSKYTPFYRNLGYQYYFHVDWNNDFLGVSLKPGTHTYRFKRQSEIVFQDEVVDQENPYTLRYLEIPLEVKYIYALERIQPYIGLVFSYAHLLGSNASETSSFIPSKISLGAMGGAYIDLQFLILDVNLGYNNGLHLITRKSQRSQTDRPDAYAQSDIRLNDIRLNVSVLFVLQKRRSTGKAACNYQRRGPKVK